MSHCTALALFTHTAHVLLCRKHSSAQLSSVRACTVVLSTEEAAYIEIVTRGPEGLARASEARGSGNRENPELWLNICIGKETEAEL